MVIHKRLLIAWLFAVELVGGASGQGNRPYDPSTMFDSVVTVWSEFGHGTGFIVDPRGLILTNERVIGPSEIISVQFDPQHKVRATLIIADKEKDIAILRANLSPCPNCLVASMAAADGKPPGIAAGDKIVAVSSPLGPLKLTTSGEVYALDAQTLQSDITTDPWTSGGPVLNSQGIVVGMTSAAGQTIPGRGPSKIIRIGEAATLLEQARSKLPALAEPAPALLPVESADVFPRDGLEQAMESKKFNIRPYFFDAGDYRVFLATPTMIYRLRTEMRLEEEKRRAKHKGKAPEAIPDVTDVWELKNWAPYLAEYTPVVEIVASSHLRETRGSVLGRALTGGTFSEPWRMKFKTDFYKMKLRCGDDEIPPIQTGKIEEVVDNSARFTKITNSTSRGFYSYPPGAIAAVCGHVTLELYSMKDPDKPTIKVLDSPTVERIWSDFDAYRKAQAAPEKP